MTAACEDLRATALRIIEWGDKHGDEFPWRDPATPYESAVAEILLIRTPPEQVLPVYERFLDRYPDPQTLRETPKEEIEHEIEPVGLRWRAERLVSMAEYVCEELAGDYPHTHAGLQDVPGIGPYAAAAIMLFCYERRGVLVDANSVRFIERYCGRTFGGEARRNKELIAIMDELTPAEDEFACRFGASFLDFMRKVCSPARPMCEECFLSTQCHHGQQRTGST